MQIFNVMHSEEYVGEFYQCSFSTMEKAEEWIAKQTYFDDKENCYVVEHLVDEGFDE